MSLFDPYDVDEQAFLLAEHIPVGRLWEASFDPNSNLGKLVRGLAIEYYRLELLIKDAADEADIDKANQLLIEWEKSVGLPDSCFSTNISIEERRKQVKAKFSKFGGVQTAEDFVRVAALFGFDIMVIPGIVVGSFPLEFPLLFFEDTKAATHFIFIQIQGTLSGDAYYPLPFPIPFSTGGTTFLECIFKKLAPANVEVAVIDESSI